MRLQRLRFPALPNYGLPAHLMRACLMNILRYPYGKVHNMQIPINMCGTIDAGKAPDASS